MEDLFKKYSSEQEELWNNDLGEQWAKNFKSLDSFLKPWGDEILNIAKINSGESVIDIGCGAGTIAFEVLKKVGTTGKVLGIDISDPLINCAKKRKEKLGYSNIKFIHANAESYNFTYDFDVVISRFGLMFFGNPLQALSNIRRALKKSGKLFCVVWGTPRENQWVSIPITIAKKIIKNTPPPLAEGEPGPFSFSDQNYVKHIFEKSGWNNIMFNKINREVILGSSIKEATELLITRGPIKRLIQNEKNPIKLLIKKEISEALGPYYKNGKCSVFGSCWLISAAS